MKHSICIFTVTTFISVVSIAQGSSRANLSEHLNNPIIKTRASATAPGLLKAEKNFLKTNVNAQTVQWFEIDGGFVAHYTQDGHNGKSYYGKRGKFLWSILSYEEKFLPQEIIKQVKSVFYFDYKITHASEISRYVDPGNKIYLIQITNGKVWKKVSVLNGEMEIVEEFKAL